MAQDGGCTFPSDLGPGIARLVEFRKLPVKIGQLEPGGEDGMDVIEKLVIGGDQLLLDPGEKLRAGKGREDGQGRRIKLPVEDVLPEALEVLCFWKEGSMMKAAMTSIPWARRIFRASSLFWTELCLFSWLMASSSIFSNPMKPSRTRPSSGEG